LSLRVPGSNLDVDRMEGDAPISADAAEIL
jgi:hypothetical protein